MFRLNSDFFLFN